MRSPIEGGEGNGNEAERGDCQTREWNMRVRGMCVCVFAHAGERGAGEGGGECHVTQPVVPHERTG